MKILAGVLGVLLLACCGTATKLAVSGYFESANSASSVPTAAIPSGISATSTATAAPTAPFVGTPAEDYAEGEAGITMPAATAVTGFTKTQVATALAKVKQAMIAARLDPTMVVSRDNSALLKLLAPDSRDGIKSDFSDKNFFSYASQVAPGYTLTVDGIRVKGRVTFRATKQDGIRMLEVITNFVWVYPFTGYSREPGDQLVIVHDEVHWVVPVDADVERSSRGLWINEASGYASNIDCDLLDQSLLARGEPQFVPGASNEDPNAAFDPNRSLEIEDTC